MKIYNTWGSSESGGVIFCDVNEAASSDTLCGSLGRPVKGVAVEILDKDGRVLDQSDAAHPGRMALRGNMAMLGYWKDEELTSQTLKDGRLLTGDLAYIKDDHIFMLGRADDLINVGGEKVSPIEIENIASEYPHIRECACIGADDPKQIARLKKATLETAERKNVYFYGFENPQTVILISNDRRNPNGCQDASCAAENIMLAATSYGIGSVWLNPLQTLRDCMPVKQVLDDFGISDKHIVWATVALGYPVNNGVLLQKNPDVVKYV